MFNLVAATTKLNHQLIADLLVSPAAKPRKASTRAWQWLGWNSIVSPLRDHQLATTEDQATLWCETSSSGASTVEWRQSSCAFVALESRCEILPCFEDFLGGCMYHVKSEGWLEKSWKLGCFAFCYVVQTPPADFTCIGEVSNPRNRSWLHYSHLSLEKKTCSWLTWFLTRWTIPSPGTFWWCIVRRS